MINSLSHQNPDSSTPSVVDLEHGDFLQKKFHHVQVSMFKNYNVGNLAHVLYRKKKLGERSWFQWLLMHELDEFMCSIHVAAGGGHTGYC
ncbi:unnamed protein product [Lactuca saligna]|uniref:Uncharacterized protein n=1 Tax=Lactuca saligna TaxID=75948 RepID=A0AA35Z6Y4_LACSI|nr:unnamed protein product [Lactuca saligna]